MSFMKQKFHIIFTKETKRHDLKKQIIWRLEWLGMSPARKAGGAKPWEPPGDSVNNKGPPAINLKKGGNIEAKVKNE